MDRIDIYLTANDDDLRIVWDEDDDMELSGNETPRQIAELLAMALEQHCLDHLDIDADIEVITGFQPYVTLRLRNGAEWQITPVRSAWPRGGASVQWDGDEED